MREVCFLIGAGGQVLWSDAGTSATALPDAFERWRAIWRLRGELVEVRDRIEAMASMQSLRADQAQRITDVAALAERARGRLENASAAMRREVVDLLDVRVIVSDIVQGRPQAITIHGVLDPSMFLPADAAERKPSEAERSCRSCS